MRSWLIVPATLLALGLAFGEARACPEDQVVQGWYQHFLGRPLDCLGQQVWVSQLRGGVPPTQVQAEILASEEYFCKHGHCPQGFVAGLYRDVLGRTACAHEVQHWVARMGQCGCRKTLAREFLCAAGGAPVAQPAPPPVASVYHQPAYTPPAPAYQPPPAPAYGYRAPAYQPPPAPAAYPVNFRRWAR